MFDILSKLSELAPDMVSRRPNGPPPQILMPSQMAIGEMMQGAQEGLARPTRQEQYGTPMTMGRPTRGQEYGNATITSDGSPAPQRLAMPGPETKGFDSKGAAGALLNASMSMGGSDEEIKHASFDLPGASSNGIRQQTISGLRGYRLGGRLRPGDMGIVGEEDPEVIRARKGGGVDVIPIDSDSEADTQGYFQANPTDAPIPDGVQQTVAAAQQGQPDARQLINPQDQARADEYGKLDVERQKTTKSPWKDAGFGILQGLNNALNNRNDPIQGWNEFGEEKRMRPIKQRIGELEHQRKVGLDTRKDEANIDILEQRPGLEESKRDLAEFRAINDAEYKRNTAALGKEKADEVKANNQRIFDLKRRGLDQNDTRIKLLEQRNEEIKRHNVENEKILQAKPGQEINKQQVIAQLRDHSAELQKLLADKNNAASQARAAEIQKQMLVLRKTLDQ